MQTRRVHTVRQFAARFAAWTEPAMRNLILNAEDRLNSRGELIAGNGLAAAGAIVRVGRRVLVDEDAFFAWLAELQSKQRVHHQYPQRRDARATPQHRQCEAMPE